VIARSGFDPGDHSGKALINVLESYPRDELFQISVPILRKHAEAILALGERPRVRVLFRVDQFDRFVSVIVFVPRDRYDSHVRERIGDIPEDGVRRTFVGVLSGLSPKAVWRASISSSAARGTRPRRSRPRRWRPGLRAIVRTWDDALREAAADGRCGAGDGRHRQPPAAELSQLVLGRHCAARRGQDRECQP
jgi:glutamate dehydrogenase